MAFRRRGRGGPAPRPGERPKGLAWDGEGKRVLVARKEPFATHALRRTNGLRRGSTPTQASPPAR